MSYDYGSVEKFKVLLSHILDEFKDLIPVKGTSHLLSILYVDKLYVDFDDFYKKYRQVVIDGSKDKNKIKINDDKLLDLLAFVL